MISCEIISTSITKLPPIISLFILNVSPNHCQILKSTCKLDEVFVQEMFLSSMQATIYRFRPWRNLCTVTYFQQKLSKLSGDRYKTIQG